MLPEIVRLILLKKVKEMNKTDISLRMLQKTDVQGKGIATAATGKLVEIVFEELKLNRIFLNLLSDNIKAIRMYEKCDFVYEGEFRQHFF